MNNFKIDLQWKSFNVNLDEVRAWLKANAESFDGLQAHSILEAWFFTQPSEEVIQVVKDYWDALTEESTTYISADQIKAEVALAKARAHEKLSTLGFTPAEIAAL